MNRLILTIIALGFFFFTACKKDSPPLTQKVTVAPDIRDSLVGTYITSAHVASSQYINNQWQTDSTPLSGTYSIVVQKSTVDTTGLVVNGEEMRCYQSGHIYLYDLFLHNNHIATFSDSCFLKLEIERGGVAYVYDTIYKGYKQ